MKAVCQDLIGRPGRCECTTPALWELLQQHQNDQGKNHAPKTLERHLDRPPDETQRAPDALEANGIAERQHSPSQKTDQEPQGCRYAVVHPCLLYLGEQPSILPPTSFVNPFGG